MLQKKFWQLVSFDSLCDTKIKNDKRETEQAE